MIDRILSFPITRAAGLLFASVTLAGCASTKEDLFANNDHLPNMLEVYQQHMSGSGTTDGLRSRPGPAALPAAATAAQFVSHTRDAGNELALQFAPLPNPTLLMYVDPHLTANGLPVPGYTTAFTLYERTEYALPGEVPPAPVAPWRPLSNGTSLYPPEDPYTDRSEHPLLNASLNP